MLANKYLWHGPSSTPVHHFLTLFGLSIHRNLRIGDAFAVKQPLGRMTIATQAGCINSDFFVTHNIEVVAQCVGFAQ